MRKYYHHAIVEWMLVGCASVIVVGSFSFILMLFLLFIEI